MPGVFPPVRTFQYIGPISTNAQVFHADLRVRERGGGIYAGRQPARRRSRLSRDRLLRAAGRLVVHMDSNFRREDLQSIGLPGLPPRPCPQPTASGRSVLSRPKGANQPPASRYRLPESVVEHASRSVASRLEQRRRKCHGPHLVHLVSRPRGYDAVRAPGHTLARDCDIDAHA